MIIQTKFSLVKVLAIFFAEEAFKFRVLYRREGRQKDRGTDPSVVVPHILPCVFLLMGIAPFSPASLVQTDPIREVHFNRG